MICKAEPKASRGHRKYANNSIKNLIEKLYSNIVLINLT